MTATERTTARPSPEPTLALWEGAAFLATGGALVVHILLDVPLWLSVAAAVTGAACVVVLAVRRHPGGVDAGREMVAVGFRSAAVALLAYDASRVVLVRSAGFGISPFEAFRHFGAGLLGTAGTATAATWVAGVLFHIVNGITFGVAYTIIAGRRGIGAGIAFGVGLEVIMLGLYPLWLQIANVREFATMSMAGHVVYGATLGFLARRGLESTGGR